MAKLIILGSSNAIPDADHENTHMVLAGKTRTVLIDSPGTPLVRLAQAGLDSNQVTDIILTHFHPDHVSGLPPLLMGMWLMGRKAPLSIYGLEITLNRVERMMDLYDWKKWPDFFEVRFNPMAENEELSQVLGNDELKIYASPVKHIIPTIGLRMELLDSGKTVAYSCDTEPCDAVVKLARDASILIHEAAGEFFGHSSARQAGQDARQARVKALVLIHYDTSEKKARMLEEARSEFDGNISLANDFDVIDLT